jgi:hypothetical protein
MNKENYGVSPLAIPSVSSGFIPVAVDLDRYPFGRTEWVSKNNDGCYVKTESRVWDAVERKWIVTRYDIGPDHHKQSACVTLRTLDGREIIRYFQRLE